MRLLEGLDGEEEEGVLALDHTRALLERCAEHVPFPQNLPCTTSQMLVWGFGSSPALLRLLHWLQDQLFFGLGTAATEVPHC
jgi:hypothetical protein